MSKRFPKPLPSDRGAGYKKARLDVSIGRRTDRGDRNGEIGSTQTFVQPSGNNWNPQRFDEPAGSNCNFFDDDDDDEMLLMATQKVEQNNDILATQCNQELPATQFAANDYGQNYTSVTFTEFGFGQNVASSTQLPAAPPPAPPTAEYNDVYKFLLEDDDDWEIASPAKPLTPLQTTSNGNHGNFKNQESQMQMLQQQLEKVNKDYEQLSKDLDMYKQNIQTKDGEVTMLRQEVRSLKQQIDKLRMDKIQETGKAKAEWQSRIEELSKQLKAKETELEFKKVEVARLKTRNLDESIRYREDSLQVVDIRPNLDIQMFNLNLDLSGYVEQSIEELPADVVNNSKAKSSCPFSEFVAAEYEKLRNVFFQLRITNDLDRGEEQTFVEMTIASIKAVLPAYRHQLDLNSKKFQENTSAQTDDSNVHGSIFQSKPLRRNERDVTARRFIAITGFLCRRLNGICTRLLNDEQPTIDVAIEIIRTLGESPHKLQYFGVLEAFAYLISSWLVHVPLNPLLAQYLKALIFGRPDIRTMLEITNCFSRISSDFDLLCDRREEEETRHTRQLKFLEGSCILQVYGALLEAHFSKRVELTATGFDNLLTMCYNHAKFLSGAFGGDSLPVWIREEIKVWKEGEKRRTHCHCYSKVWKSFLWLFYRLIQEWTDRKSLASLFPVHRIVAVSKLATSLIYTIFVSYYSDRLFRHGSHQTQQSLYLICKYLRVNFTQLELEKSHEFVIDSILKSHIVSVEPYCEITKTNCFSEPIWSKRLDEDVFFS